MAEARCYAEIFDTRGDGLKCVRFESGVVGVVDERDTVIYSTDKFRHIVFVKEDFVKLRTTKAEMLHDPELRYMLREEGCSSPHIFYVDLKSCQIFGSMPKLHRYGDFELLFLREHMFTRTNPCYTTDTNPSFITPTRNGLVLQLPYEGTPEPVITRKLFYRHKLYYKCLIKGEEDRLFWFETFFEDESVMVMDDAGLHYYVRMDNKTGKAIWRELGIIGNYADMSMMNMTVNDINAEVRNRMLCDKEEEQKAAARNRKKTLSAMTSVEPFQIGNKWGLKHDGRIIVPPTYRTIHPPMGKYCAVEAYPGIWGVISVDGRVEIEPRYEGVKLRPDGTVELTVYGDKVVKKKLL